MSAPIEIGHLPSIPTLPPIQMPASRTDNDFGEAEYAKTSTSYTSEDSFATAYTSSPHSTSGPSASSNSPPLQPLSMTSSLRRSLSADSFINRRRDHPSPTAMDTELRTAQRDSVIDPDMNRWRARSHSGSSQSPHAHLPPGSTREETRRTRGGSLSAASDELADAAYDDDSDVEPPRGASKTRERGNSRSSKGKDSGTVASHILLVSPSRLSDLNGVSKLRRSLSTDKHIRPKPGPRIPLSSLDHQRIMTVKASENVPGSVRTSDPSAQLSSSSGVDLSQSNKRITIKTENLESPDINQFVIAVVGSTGCGKSAFIHKSLKHGITDAETCPKHTGEEVVGDVAYSYRTARMKTESSSEWLLKMIEVDSGLLLRGESESLGPVWPIGLPVIDGVFVCYDASDVTSLEHVGKLLKGYDVLKVPAIVLACKSDLEKRATPQDALNLVQNLAGIVEVTNRTPAGKIKMRKSLDVLLKAIIKRRRTNWKDSEIYRNPASPDVVNAPTAPWDGISSNNGTPTASSSMSSIHCQVEQPTPLSSSVSVTTRSPSTPTSPTRARSTGDLLSEHQKSIAFAKQRERDAERTRNSTKVASRSAESLSATVDPPELSNPMDDVMNENQEGRHKDPPPTPWATLEELLDKLFFLSVSGDDPAFISNFFLTYRRFATPRSVLLGMQKRMIELNQPSDDFMLASFAQMRLCNLLDNWMKDYPTDFAVQGTSGALSAIAKQTLSHTHTLHYGSDFLPFIEMLPTLTDEDATWAMKAEETPESDESDGLFEENDESDNTEVESPTSISPLRSTDTAMESMSDVRSPGRERKSSLPLSAKSILQVPPSHPSSGRPHPRGTQSGKTSKDVLSRLAKAAQQLLNVEASVVAREITRIELDLFLKMKPRHWLRHTLVPGKKNPDTDPIARFHGFYNQVHDWAVSLILCHDRPKARARQIEKFAEIASELRALNNYSGLRAIVTAISNSTYPGDLPMEIFKTKTELYKKFRSSDILLHSTGSHKSYRLALRNTKGPCVPALEVHMSDLMRAHEGNPDCKFDDPTKIHWGKFNMIGKFISTTSQYQAQCRNVEDYKFDENAYVRELLLTPPMDYELQQARMTPPADYDGVDTSSPPFPQQTAQDVHGHSKDIGIARRKFFW